MKNLANLNINPFTNEEVMKLIKLYQYKGKDYYYQEKMQSDLDTIIKQTVERDCYEFADYLSLAITDNRKNLIIKKGNQPKNIEEKFLTNLKVILSKIQADVSQFEFITNDVLSLNKMLYKGIHDISFNTTKVKVKTNMLYEEKKLSMRDSLQELLSKYEALCNSGKYEITYIIVNFYVDLINMNLFNYGNDIISLIMIYILLLKANFKVFKFVSFFQLLNLHKATFKNVVLQANYNYEEGFSKTAPLQKFIIDLMLQGYDKIEAMVHEYSFDSAINKSDNIENTIYKLPQIFTKDDIRERHPYVSESTINRTLQKLRDQDIIRPNGVGRSASWIRLVSVDSFNPDYKQMELFSDENGDNSNDDSTELIEGFNFNLDEK